MDLFFLVGHLSQNYSSLSTVNWGVLIGISPPGKRPQCYIRVQVFTFIAQELLFHSRCGTPEPSNKQGECFGDQA
ncbi:hypothetical protein ACSBR1_001148 [Camellia fascicularis]